MSCLVQWLSLCLVEVNMKIEKIVRQFKDLKQKIDEEGLDITKKEAKRLGKIVKSIRETLVREKCGEISAAQRARICQKIKIGG